MIFSRSIQIFLIWLLKFYCWFDDFFVILDIFFLLNVPGINIIAINEVYTETVFTFDILILTMLDFLWFILLSYYNPINLQSSSY